MTDLYPDPDPPAAAEGEPQPEAPPPEAPLPDLPPERRPLVLAWLVKRLAAVCRFRAADLGREHGYATPADAHRLLDGRRDLAGFGRGVVAEAFGGLERRRFG